MRYLYILWAFYVQQEREKNYSICDFREILLENYLLPSKNKSGFQKKSGQETLDSLIHPL